jgi:hypothetical protein
MRGCEDEKIQTPTIGRTLRSAALGKKYIYSDGTQIKRGSKKQQ